MPFWGWTVRSKRALLALAPAVLLLLPPAELLMLTSSVLLHEGGHLLAFWATGEPPPSLGATLGGLTFAPRRPLSYRQEIAIALAGPLANLSLALPLLSVGGVAAAVGCVHLLTGLLNLLPLGRSDGARALSDLLFLLLPPDTAERLARGVSHATFFLLLFPLLYLLLYEGGGNILLLLLSLLARANFTE